VIVRDLHSIGPVGGPLEADPVLIVDANAVLAVAITPERFQTIPWRHPKILEPFDRIALIQLPVDHSPQVSRALVARRLRVLVVEAIVSMLLFGAAYRRHASWTLSGTISPIRLLGGRLSP
jgi:hypothetical protein